MKGINLVSLSESLDTPAFGAYSAYHGIKIKESEKTPIKLVCKKLLDAGAIVGNLNNFYFGYSIPHIGKEFDFLRIGQESIIDVEVKSESTEETIKKQLIQNKKYLSVFGKHIYLYAYMEKNDTLYALDNADNLIKTTFDKLLLIIKEQTELLNTDLDHLFDTHDYLVSPFNSTDNFMQGYYFLTSQQDEITKSINDLFAKSTGNIVSINGAAGTGKSLLIYDYAKMCLKNGLKPLIVHVAQLNPGHTNLMEKYGFSISQIKTFMGQIIDNENFLNNFDVILIDESQRLHNKQIENIIEAIKRHQTNCIFSYDEKQTLSNSEKNSISVVTIQNNSIQQHKLSKKIRTNSKLIPFINSMFDLNKDFVGTSDNISLVYFTDFKNAVEYIRSNIDYKFIRPTPSMFNKGAVNKLEGLENCAGSAHDVIGQEFDNVSVLVGGAFYYDDKKKLKSTMVDGNPYDFLGMLYQGVTRAKKKLEVVIVNNPDVYKALTGILK